MQRAKSQQTIEQFVRTYSLNTIVFDPEERNDFTFFQQNSSDNIQVNEENPEDQIKQNKSVSTTYQSSLKRSSCSIFQNGSLINKFKSISTDTFIEKYKSDRFFKIKVIQTIKNFQQSRRDDNLYSNIELKFEQSFQLTLKWKRIISHILNRIIYEKWKNLIKLLEQEYKNQSYSNIQ